VKRCYYETLEIDRSASSQEIKAAYRKKALEFHPDRNSDHHAEENFKEASEAYEVLSDPQKREVYDQFGHQGLDQQGIHHGYSDLGDIFSHFGDIFEDFFGMGSSRRRSQSTAGRDLRYDLQITFMEAYKGTEKEISVRRAETCPECQGEGHPPGESPISCQHCEGTGQLFQSQGFFTISTTCRVCGGRGQVLKNYCKDCSGEGRVLKSKKLKVKIPPGVDHGMQLCLRNEGEGGRFGSPNGDLYILIHVEPHTRYQRKGKDILVQQKIPMVVAALGEKLKIETPSGMERLEIPPGTQTGDVLKIPKVGMVDLNGKSPGNLLVHIFVETPKGLNKKQKKLLEEFAALNSPKNSKKK